MQICTPGKLFLSYVGKHKHFIALWETKTLCNFEWCWSFHDLLCTVWPYTNNHKFQGIHCIRLLPQTFLLVTALWGFSRFTSTSFATNAQPSKYIHKCNRLMKQERWWGFYGYTRILINFKFLYKTNTWSSIAHCQKIFHINLTS